MIATAHAEPIAGPQSLTPEWFEARTKGIGSSESAKAIGLSDYGSQLELFAEKTGRKKPFAGNRACRRGKHHEALIAQDWQEINNQTLELYPAPLFIHPELPWMRATPDGIINRKRLLEIKFCGWRMKEKFGDQGTDEIPTDYLIQAQHQMAVMGADAVDFAVLFELDADPVAYLVERNDKLIERMISIEQEFWERIVRDDPPQPDWKHAGTPDLIKELYNVETGETVILKAEDADLWNEQAVIGKRISEEEKHRKLLRAQFAFKMGNAAIAIFESGREGPIDLQVRRKKVDRKGYIVDPTSYIDIREKKGKA